MRKNKNTTIEGERVLLVPYKEKHVLKYHEWMKSPELQHLTASEPLSLEEEYSMQKSWLEDEDKCTFIILDKQIYYELNDEIAAMVGDTNLFFNEPENNHCGEIEIMIAEKNARGKRMGWEATLIMLQYGIQELNIVKYLAKIALDNEISIVMFKKIGFTEISKSEVFQEVTLEKVVSDDWIMWLKDNLKTVKYNKYIE